MVFAKALQRAQKAQVQKGGKSNIDIPDQDREDCWEKPDPEQVPMMYRAQVSGRCSLQYAKNNQDLDRWTEEWVYPKSEDSTPFNQYAEAHLGRDGAAYRIKIDFPFRVFTNCGQDSILRPTIGKNGIPFIPGSGIKGLFRRVCDCQDEEYYCGSGEQQGILRFHGAYPIGDWAGTKTVVKDNEEKICYRFIDVVHPQQERQVQGKGSPKAIAIASFYQPTFVFELSSTKPLADKEWQKIEGLLKQALRAGIGGKTSTGYGLCFIPQDKYPLWVSLKGIGVSPLLRSNEPEFRPNVFKATLKGHVNRLLAGITNDENLIKSKISTLFGDTGNPGKLQIYWQTNQEFPKYDTQGIEKTPVYETKGQFYLDAPNQDINFLKKVVEFTLIMGGLGKSWRRVWHKDFFSDYKTRAIGCHWEWLDSDFNNRPLNDAPAIEDGRIAMKNSNDLKTFLEGLRQELIKYLGINAKAIQCLSWKESWCPQRLSVYSQVVAKSQAIELFHNEIFKTTPAIGGRNPGDSRPTSVSCVWHRMLPIGGNQYLEIVTLFHGGNSGNSPGLNEWKRQGVNQLPEFVKKLKSSGFTLTWGS
ncbi:MAG TPA: hypothetical protein DEG17_07240 [Cyanobacteria bacterium UBA11149]|nr:hypothetical protein [Cyanobacteria bacterium UBA11367]HBE59460.1 hypothetical protein [Cyanobacteria bacterium UBA11366]HBK65312.1 hypothetical protein [Cyanobacteria bacterium UBA11166]HBR75188.1 hypothetical protein [Cyanobacteria bacterium UBA11159]HBS68824.1 hypothetical protein [Cyanobacteria bacterium UBA11153]HBW88659.1 hypothetical protein [Cyanobacteria bacterium UBA11149]HCA97849.1 hypothetical protein [Cyanobacteria bacterium UBA9226]